MVTDVFLGLGSNYGDRLRNLYQALAELVKLGPLVRSSWYETEPVAMSGAMKFLNGVVRLWTTLPAPRLLVAIQQIEERLGRVREREVTDKQPRTIDIDILFYGDEVISSPELVVPHPRIPERAFVLVPLCELAPDKRHPVLKLTIRELLGQIVQNGVKKWNGN